MKLRKSQIAKLDYLLTEKHYPEKRRKTAIGYIAEFHQASTKNLQYITKTDIEEYIKNSKNSQQKFWLKMLADELIVHFQKMKLTRLDKRLKNMGINDEFTIRHLQNLMKSSGKPLTRITKEDVDAYIIANNITGDELLKVKGLCKMFMAEEKVRRKIIILNKNNKNETVTYAEVIQRIGEPSVKDLIQKARTEGKHYCPKINTNVKYCKVKQCEFNGGFLCAAGIPIIPSEPIVCDAQIPAIDAGFSAP